MGFRVLLIAVQGKDVAQIHRDYGVSPTGRFEEVPESPVVGAELPGGGGYLLFENERNVPDENVLAQTSLDGSLVACGVNETVMASFAEGWTDGARRWSVWHDSQQAPEHLESQGDVPATFGPIRDRLLAQASEHPGPDWLFDVPVELFVALGGVRYDAEFPGDSDAPWQVLERNAKPRRWWQIF